MKKYLIYTTNSVDPFIVETEDDLIRDLENRLAGNVNKMRIQHTKELLGMGKFRYDVLLNVSNIVSITTSERI